MLRLCAIVSFKGEKIHQKTKEITTDLVEFRGIQAVFEYF